MARESFADGQIAELLNRDFVSIKVDREERPDLDRIYQQSHRLLTRRNGGWPLTAFLDPDSRVAFFAGTYFPRRPRAGLPGFAELLTRIRQLFDSRRDELREQNTRLVTLLSSLASGDAGLPAADGSSAPADDAQTQTQRARDLLEGQYDRSHGGFGGAPKFPLPTALRFLLHRWADSRDGQPDRALLDLVVHSLTAMARGGINDQLGGGFFRYATDAAWQIPHFEKMLSDNGQLLSLFADAHAVTGDALFETVLGDMARWLTEDMQAEERYFCAALDAEAGGQEGGSYLWQRHEVARLLDADAMLLVETLFGLDKPANFTAGDSPRWHLTRRDAWRAVVERLSLEPAAAREQFDRARRALLDARRQRPEPARDEKLLTSWNALAIEGLVDAGERLGRGDWIDAADDATRALHRLVWKDGTLYASWLGGRLGQHGFLDDHALLLSALLRLLEVRWCPEHAAWACSLGDALVERFLDRPANGSAEALGFYFTGDDAEALIVREKPLQDDALPAGNGVACRALLRLGHLFAEPRWLDAAEQSLAWALPRTAAQPAAHLGVLDACRYRSAADQQGCEQILLTAPASAAAEMERWRRRLCQGLAPGRAVFAIPQEAAAPRPPVLPATPAREDGIVALLCRGSACSAPMTTLAEVEAALTD